MAYIAGGGEEYSCECDLEKLVGRRGTLSGEIAPMLSGTDGNTLNPCAAIRMKIHLSAGEKRQVHFALLSGEADEARLGCCSETAAVDRAIQLAQTQARGVLRFSGIDERQYRILQRAAAFLLDGGLKDRRGCAEPARKELRWSMGISRELPLMLMETGDPAQLNQARQLSHDHGL